MSNQSIEDVLAHRRDLGSFLVHLTRDHEDANAQDNLLSILKSGRIEARNAFGVAVGAMKRASISLDSQRVVCFTEAPLQEVVHLTANIARRRKKFRPYGVAVPKVAARKAGANPVWYAAEGENGEANLARHFSRLVRDAVKQDRKGRARFTDSPVASLAPYVETMGSSSARRMKEFWWEREWRHVGDFQLPDRYLVIVPDHIEIEAVQRDLAREASYADDAGDPEPFFLHSSPIFIAANWSLEEIIAVMAGFSLKDVNVFHRDFLEWLYGDEDR